LFICTKSVNCSTSSVADLSYYVSALTSITIQACIVDNPLCPNTVQAALNSSGVTIAPNGFAVINKNPGNDFTILISSSE
jgi:hypothetical protein